MHKNIYSIVNNFNFAEFMGRLYIAIDEKRFVNDDAERIVKSYDTLFTDEEGDQLLNSVLIIEAYDITGRGNLSLFFNVDKIIH